MNFCNIFLAIVVVLCSCRLALPQFSGIEVAAGATAQVGKKPPVVVVKDIRGKGCGVHSH